MFIAKLKALDVSTMALVAITTPGMLRLGVFAAKQSEAGFVLSARAMKQQPTIFSVIRSTNLRRDGSRS